MTTSAPPIAPFKTLSLDELYSLDVPDLEHIVDGICPRGAFGELSAREKAGKGLLAIDLLAAVANEEPFLDCATTPCNTGYFPAEEHIREVRDRARARLGDDRNAPFLIVPLNMTIWEGEEPQRLKFEDKDALDKLSETIKQHELGLIVLDVLRELHDGPENESDYMGPLLRPIRQMAHDLNVTIIINHHHSRSNASRGSTAIKAAADFEWSFVRTDGDDDSDKPAGRLVVEGRWPRRVLHIRFGDNGRWEIAAPTVSAGEASIREHILHMLKACKQWKDAEGITRALVNPTYNLKTTQNELSRIAKETPCPIAIRRLPGRGRRKEYHCLAPGLDESPPDTSQSSGMNGKEHSNGYSGQIWMCVECRAVPVGNRYATCAECQAVHVG